MSGIKPEVIAAAQAYDIVHRTKSRNWSRVPDDQAERLIRGAAQYLAGISPDSERPVYVLIIGQDIGTDDAELIKDAILNVLREQK